MKRPSANSASPPAFWTWRKKLLLLSLVLFVTFSYYFMAHAGPWVALSARNNSPFDTVLLFQEVWILDARAEFFGEYFLILSPFLLGYFFWWFKPTVWRFIAPGCYLFLLLTVWFPALRTGTGLSVSWSQALWMNPDYITQIPAWLRFLYL